MTDIQPTNKTQIEAMCRAAGLQPETRSMVRDYDLLIADGFSKPPHFAWQRFGVEPGDFPLGCYVTFWWLMKGEDRLFVATPMFFEWMHDPQLDRTQTKQARINRARQAAESFVKELVLAKKRKTVH